jgi:hypothetical protein
MMRNLRQYLLPSLLVLALAGGLAGAQTINKAIQLSQDASGAFGVDTTNNVYFPGHILATGAAGPAPTVVGTGTPTIAGTDVAGTITMGASATTAIATFGRAYVTAPSCVLSNQTAVSSTSNIAYTILTTSISISQPSTSGNLINYHCISIS